MPEVGSASLAVYPTFPNLQNNLESGTSKHMAAAGASGGSKFGDAAASSGGARFKAGMAKAAKVAAAGLAIGIAGAIKFGGDALAEAREAQKVAALTESTIKATGGAAKVTAAQIDKLSGAISAKAGIDDEVIQRGANMLLTFKNIRNEAGKGNKIFNRTTKATADMAAAMAGGKGGEVDLKSASILLGKALNDPVKGLSALTRVGIQFTEQQKAQNKALVEGGTLNAMAAFGTKVTATEFAKIQKENNATTQETIDIIMGPLSRAQTKLFKHYEEGGHALEAQRNILKEVNSQFGGAAAAQSTEADKLRVAWGNFKEEIGGELIPVMDDLSSFLRKKGIPAAQDFIGWFKEDGVPALKKFGGYVKTAAGHAKDLAGFLHDLPAPAKIAGLVTLFGAMGYGKLRGGGLGGQPGALGTIGKVTGLTKPIRTFETNPAALGGGLGGGVVGPTSKLGKFGAILSKGALPVAIVAASGVALKNFYNWNHKDDKNPVAAGMGGGKVGEWSRNFFGGDDEKVKTYSKTIGTVNNAWAKVGKTTEGAREEVVLYDSTVRKVPTKIETELIARQLERNKRLIEQYGSLLDGLDNRTITTFFQSVVRNKPGDVGGGEAGTSPGQPPNRSGGVHVNIERVEAHDYQDFMTQLDNRTRGRSLDGVP